MNPAPAAPERNIRLAAVAKADRKDGNPGAGDLLFPAKSPLDGSARPS